MSSGPVVGRLPGSADVVVRIPEQHCDQHTYFIGASGTGKSTCLYNSIVHDLALGNGVCVVDPHGELFDRVLASIPADRDRDSPSDRQPGEASESFADDVPPAAIRVAESVARACSGCRMRPRWADKVVPGGAVTGREYSINLQRRSDWRQLWQAKTTMHVKEA